MADPIKNNDLDNVRPIYPEPSPTSALPGNSVDTFELGAGSEGDVLDAVPPVREFRGNNYSRTNEARETARQIAEQARSGFQSVASQAKDRMNQVAERASDMASQAGQRITDLKDEFNDRLPEWKHQARVRAEDARIAARRTAVRVDEQARRYPIETILAAAGTAFVVGAGMRIWRSSRG